MRKRSCKPADKPVPLRTIKLRPRQKICGCGDYTPNKNGVCDTCQLINELDAERKAKHTHTWDVKKRVCTGCDKSLDSALDEISEALRKAATDPEVIARGEELERSMRPTWEDMNRPFTI